MIGEQVQTAGGHTVGELIRISCKPENTRINRVTPHYIMLQWPWRSIDPESRRVRWSGEVALPRDPDHFEWHNTPWRVEADTLELQVGDIALVAIVPVTVRIRRIHRHDPPIKLGWLPRPEIALGVCFLGDEDKQEAGFLLHRPTAEPIVIERVDEPQGSAV